MPRPWFLLRIGSSVFRDLRLDVPQMWGSSGLVLPGVRVEGWAVRGGGVVDGQEGVRAVDQPGVGWCLVVGGEEGVVFVVHEGLVRGGASCLLLGLGMSPGTWSLKLLREATRSTHVLLCHAMVSVRVVLVGNGPCWARGSRCGPWWSPAQARGVRQGVAPSPWGAPRRGPLGEAGIRRQGWRAEGARVGQPGGER